ncbi:MAG: heme/hemin ABC transporter substrate-binding protein [Pseudoclavibacter sp.]
MNGRPTRRRSAVIAGLVATVLMLTGCAHTGVVADATSEEQRPALSELDALDDPRSYEGPSTATLTDREIEPVTDDPDQTLPTTVASSRQDGTQEQIEITDTSRVVAADLAGSIAASIWALGFGDTLVGKDQSTTFPGTEDIETVTSGGHTVNAEAIIGLAPDVVITDGTVGPRDVIEQLRDVGIVVVFVDNDASFGGAEELARQVAGIYGAVEAGELLAERIRQEVAGTIEEIAGLAPTRDEDRVRILFLYLRGDAGIYYLFGSESGADELIDALGGIDVAGELGWQGMKPMTDEALVAANPDLILTMTGGIESVGGVDGLLEDKPAIALTAAGEHRRVVDMDDGTILSFGPRSAEVIDALARAIYAPNTPVGDEPR